MLKSDKTVVISGEITPELAVQTVLKLVQLHSNLPVGEKITLFIFIYIRLIFSYLRMSIVELTWRVQWIIIFNFYLIAIYIFKGKRLC